MSALLGLWQWYAQYLVFYSEDGWVASTARTFRVLAILCIVPGIFLTILDMTTYVIARTLGDPTASTSARHIPLPPSPPPEKLDELVSGPMSPPPTIAITPAPSRSGAGADSGDEDPASRLAGVGVFSAPGSAPGSPVVQRKSLINAAELERTLSGVKEAHEHDNEVIGGWKGENAKEEAGRDGDGDGDVFGGESYALLDRDESWEDAGLQIRRRRPVGEPAGGS
ncbi:hypothetical protein PENSPDRAFT_682036 [Peniophora sp. CONT]|nr:hypothetical protein PENSPDRAFT_682036 [Peniophora sp. CONT]